MMISPEGFAAMHQEDSYKELIAIRDSLIRDIRAFEKNKIDKSEYFIEPSPDVIYQCKLLYLSEICKLIETKFNENYEQIITPSVSGNYIKGLQQATRISIDDDYYFDKAVDVLNECFGKNYKAWMRGFCYLDDEKTIGVWFPKMAVYEYGVAKSQSKTKNWVNTLSADGTIIKMASTTEFSLSRTAEPHITFAKFPGKPYKYIGTFVRDLQASKPQEVIFRRIAIELDLTPWKTEIDY